MNRKTPLFAAITVVGATLILSTGAHGLMDVSQKLLGEEGAWIVWWVALRALFGLAGALYWELQARDSVTAQTSEVQAQAWLQRHLQECTATLDAVGHESATPHLLVRGHLE